MAHKKTPHHAAAHHEPARPAKKVPHEAAEPAVAIVEPKVEPRTTPSVPAEYGARADAAAARITAAARTDVEAVVATTRAALQALYNSETGDLTRQPQVIEQIQIDDACIRLLEQMSLIFRNI